MPELLCERRRMRRHASFLVLVCLAVLVASGLAPSATAGPPGSWTVISGGPVSSIFEPGSYRTADGVLHVAMVRNNGTTESIDVAHISSSGQLLGRTAAIEGWEAVTSDPEIVGSPGGGMTLVFGGIRSTSGDPYSAGNIWQAQSDASGTSWGLSATPALTHPSGYASYGTGATTLADGTLVTAYALNSTIYYQVGVNAVQSFAVPECCAYDTTLVNDGGTVWIGWYANGSASTGQGTFVRTVYPALGPVIQVPGSVVSYGGSPSSLGTDQGVAMAARVGGGVYVAYLNGYPTAKAVALWRVGASGFKKVPDSQGADTASISPNGSGSLWISFDDGDDHARAVRTSENASSFGAVQDLKAPKKSSVVYGVNIAAGGGRADLLLNDGTSFWHQQVLAGLTLSASPAKWNGNSAKTVAFKVTDADVKVKGAKVTAAGKSCTTNKKGVCDISFSPRKGGSVGAKAKKGGYAPGQLTLKVN